MAWDICLVRREGIYSNEELLGEVSWVFMVVSNLTLLGSQKIGDGTLMELW